MRGTPRSGTMNVAGIVPKWRNGRRGRLKIVWGNPWGFDSPLRHQTHSPQGVSEPLDGGPSGGSCRPGYGRTTRGMHPESQQTSAQPSCRLGLDEGSPRGAPRVAKYGIPPWPQEVRGKARRSGWVMAVSVAPVTLRDAEKDRGSTASHSLRCCSISAEPGEFPDLRHHRHRRPLSRCSSAPRRGNVTYVRRELRAGLVHLNSSVLGLKWPAAVSPSSSCRRLVRLSRTARKAARTSSALPTVLAGSGKPM